MFFKFFFRNLNKHETGIKPNIYDDDSGVFVLTWNFFEHFVTAFTLSTRENDTTVVQQSIKTW